MIVVACFKIRNTPQLTKAIVVLILGQWPRLISSLVMINYVIIANNRQKFISFLMYKLNHLSHVLLDFIPFVFREQIFVDG